MTAARSLKQRLVGGERLLGALVRLPSETLVEMAGTAGLDYVVIDCEHGPADLVALQHHLSAAEAHGMETLVRVGSGGADLVLRCLDLGASGIIVPHVESMEEARAAVVAARYPPLGGRGFATYTRAGRYGAQTPDEHLAKAASDTLVVVMVETVRGCAEAAGILAVDGVDAVLVGPADLSVSMGLDGRTDEPSVTRAMVEVHEVARGAGRSVMSIVGSPEAARAALTSGSDLVVYNIALVLTRTFSALSDARG